MDASLRKPLGGRAYGSIPHLLGSRRGPADRGVNEGQQRICCERARDRHDVVIVQEKLDGSNCSIACIGDEIVPLTRAGYVANTSPYEQHHLFYRWAMIRRELFLETLLPGERIVGEWLAQAHGTRYALRHEPFIGFDIIADATRAPWAEVSRRLGYMGLPFATTVHQGSPLSVARALQLIGSGSHGAIDPVEGAVWRVERKGRVDFLAKYVRPEKIDGAFLPEISGSAPVWNWSEPASEAA